MRELHGYHGEHRRHAHDAPAATDAPGKHAHDRTHDAPKFKVLLDPEARKAEHLRYRKIVDAAYEPKHAADQLKPQEPKPLHRSPEITDRPASGIERRSVPAEKETTRQAKSERSWLPSNETTQLVTSVGALASVVADAVNCMPARLDAVAASVLAVVVAGVAWGNKRWKDKHGD